MLDEKTLEQLSELYYADYELMHYGMPRRSGRYPWGSGDDPFQHEPFYNQGDFYRFVRKLQKQGLTDKEIYEGLGINSSQFRTKMSNDRAALRKLKIDYAKSAQKDGKSLVQIGKEIGEKYGDGEPINESVVRSLLNADAEERMNKASNTANNLRKIVDEKGIIDVGTGVERELGVSKEKMKAALAILEEEGYTVQTGKVAQPTNAGKNTTLKVLMKPGTDLKDARDYSKIHHVTEYTSDDNGETFRESFHYPESLDSKRLAIRYAEDGGTKKDGTIEIRRGCKDLSLGNSNYSQVRILVDGTHYLKGMAVYSDDLPDGVDVLFNTNKPKSTPALGPKNNTVLKTIKKDDPTNPFGSAIKNGVGEHGGQSYYIGDDGKEHLSLINKRSDEGDWGEWSKEIPSQFLSKQSTGLIRRQLTLTEQRRENEYQEIMSITNPAVKRKMLIEYADGCDKAADELKAAAFPGQKYQVILPLETIKDNEIYAPNYKDGEQLALVRYPHAGVFEIPVVTVNNRNKEGISSITPNAKDAVGISAKTASQLSGADFDGDTVMVIPLSDSVKITHSKPLKGLEGFDPTMSYGPDPTETYTDDKGVTHYMRQGREYKVISEQYKQKQMGVVSNLITDMTLKNATEEELARAVRHSMVVIDAEKHKLDYKASEEENGIAALKDKYQGHIDPETGTWKHGAQTLISKAASEVDIPKRAEGAYVSKKNGHTLKLIDEKTNLYLDESTGEVLTAKDKITQYIDPKTGKKLYRNTDEINRKIDYIGSDGKKKSAWVNKKDDKLYYKNDEGKYIIVPEEDVTIIPKTQKATRMSLTDDAMTLSSGTQQEKYYAQYANKLKALANNARKESLTIEDTEYSPEAKKEYADEVESLNAKLDTALMNAPKERAAILLTQTQAQEMQRANPGMTKEEIMKQKQRLLAANRARVGAKRQAISFTDREWEAIQKGAISKNKLEEILANVDDISLKEHAMPRSGQYVLSKGQISRLKSLSRQGYTNAEIAETFGISTSTVADYLK